MLAVELLSLLASASAFAAGFLIGSWWRGGRLERVVVVPASPPMRPPPPQVEPVTRSPYAPRPKPAAKPLPQPIERVVRWRRDADNSPPMPAAKPTDVMALPKAPTIAAALVTTPGALLPSITWGQSCASK